MHKTRTRHGLLLGILAACLGGCAATPRAPEPPDPADVESFHRQAQTREAARVIYAEGVYLREVGNNRAALQRFTEAVRLDPEDPTLRLALARHYLQLGAVQDAARLLDEFAARYALSAEEHLLAARLHVVAGRDSAAMSDLEACLAADSTLVDAWLLHGRLLLDDDQPEAALESLRRAERLEPYRAATHLRLGDCWLELGARDAAETAYRQAVLLNPDMQAARSALANLYREDGRLDEAIAVYQEALEQQPADQTTVSTLLELLLDTRRYEDAARLLEPRHRDGLLDPRQQYVYGWLLLQLGALERAQVVLEPLAEQHGADGVFALLGELALRDGRLDEARRNFERAVQAQPDECAAYVSLVGVMIESLRDEDGRLDSDAETQEELRAVLMAASDATPRDAYRCNVLLGIAYAQLRDFEGAARHLEAGHAIQPHDADVMFNLAMAHQELGHFDAALQLGREILELEPENPAALNFVGYILAERGVELEDSERLIRRALHVEPDNGYYVDSLGWVFYKRGLYERAAVELERAVELTDNKDPIILEHLGDAYAKMGQLDGAYRVYTQSKELAPDNPALLVKIDDLLQRMGKP